DGMERHGFFLEIEGEILLQDDMPTGKQMQEYPSRTTGLSRYDYRSSTKFIPVRRNSCPRSGTAFLRQWNFPPFALSVTGHLRPDDPHSTHAYRLAGNYL